MSKTKKKPLLNRKETQSLLKTLKVASTTGVLSLTLAGWGFLAQLESNTAQAAPNQTLAMVEAPAETSNFTRVSNVATLSSTPPTPTPSPSASPKIKLNVVQWVQDVQGNPVAVVQDRRGSLWYVMGSDVPRLEQGLSPKVQPQLVRTVTRTRAS
jgi:hypothetical protein